MNNTNTDTNIATETPRLKGRYEVQDAISGETVKVIPLQFRNTANRLGITEDELVSSYVGHTGKRVLKARGLTQDEATAEYPAIHPNVMAKLGRCFKKPVRARKAKKDETPTELMVSPAATDENPVDNETEVVYVDDTPTVEV